MAAKRKRSGGRRPSQAASRGDRERRRGTEERIRVRRVEGDGGFELVYPRCVRQRAEDLEEVHLMLDAGEIDVAVDELRWLLDGCDALLEAHKLLGEIAMADGDLALARGHLGYVYELGLGALGPGFSGMLPCCRPAIQPFFEAGKGLAWCFLQLGEKALAAQFVEKLVSLDLTDPLGLRGMLAE